MEPGYGETPLAHEEAEALQPSIREALGEPISKAEIYDIEQQLQTETTTNLLAEILCDAITLDDLLTDFFIRDLHFRLYGDLWQWAGRFRVREMTIGIAPEQIASELRNTLDNIRYRWQHTDDWTPRQLGIVVHAETVRIHPFTDGNGRTTRLLGDLVFTAAQTGETLQRYDWDLHKRTYIDLLRKFDEHRDPRELAAFVPVCPFGD
ncbi:Fic family protein [Nocardia sp. NPDC004068]|uniref:Fic family protein n=1 Tax=Nocardia sp. NPDC004068 TaxID=3364303 RepID=UPI0036A35ECC